MVVSTMIVLNDDSLRYYRVTIEQDEEKKPDTARPSIKRQPSMPFQLYLNDSKYKRNQTATIF